MKRLITARRGDSGTSEHPGLPLLLAAVSSSPASAPAIITPWSGQVPGPGRVTAGSSRRDQQRALEFYTTKLGFRVITDQPFDDRQRWIELSVGDSMTAIVLFIGFAPAGQQPTSRRTFRLFELRRSDARWSS